MKCPVLNKVYFNDSIFVERLLPTDGKIFVKKGDKLNSYDKIGEAMVVKEKDAVTYSGDVMCSVGDIVSRGDILAKKRHNLFRFKEYFSPLDGEIKEIDKNKKQIFIESKSQNFSLISGVDGEVVNTSTGKSVLIKTNGVYIKGVYGFGSEVCGEILFLSGGDVTEKDINENVQGKILVAKSFTPPAVAKAKIYNALGFVFSSDQYFEIKKYSTEKIPLIVLEGFGDLPFNLIYENFFRKYNSLFGILRTYENSLIVTGKSISDFDYDFSIPKFFEIEVLENDILQLFNRENFCSIAKVIGTDGDKIKVKLLDPTNSQELEIDPQYAGIISRDFKKPTTLIPKPTI